jgi:hypothetical protein
LASLSCEISPKVLLARKSTTFEPQPSTARRHSSQSKTYGLVALSLQK